jgi:wyosine [tRNA(Phe)-imidazoG37] synthetase (radical SAM superfamily)
VERLQEVLGRLDRAALAILDLRNREVTSVGRSAQGLLGLMADTLAVGAPAWGPWSLVDARLRTQSGHERFSLLFAAAGKQVELGLLPDADDPDAARAWLTTPLGKVVTLRDERDDADRRLPEHQLERPLAFMLATSLHAGMRWVAPSPSRRAADLLTELGLPEQLAARCGKPWLIAERLGSGRLLPCCERFIEETTLAQCETTATGSLLAAWNSAGMQRIRRAWATGRPEDACVRDCPRFHGGSEADNWLREAPRSRAAHDNAALALREMAAGAEVLRARPQCVMISVSDRCNSRCIMCSLQAQPGTDVGEVGTVLTEAEAEEVESLFPVLRLLSVSGGEPLLEPRARSLIARLDAERFPDGTAHMVTNGLLLTPSLTRELRRTRLALTVSVNAACAETHELITGVRGGFEQVVGNLRVLVEAGRDFVARPQLTLSLVVMRSNFRELPAFMRLARSLDADLRLLPVFGDQAGQSIFTSEALLREVTDFLEQRVLPETAGLAPSFGHMVGHMIRVQRARLERRDFTPY